MRYLLNNHNAFCIIFFVDSPPATIDQNKIHKISDKILIAAVGDTGDAIQFTEYISKNLALYKMRNGYELTPKSAAHYTRRVLATHLRSRSPYHCNLFVAGYDDKEGSELHYIDYIANGKSLNYAGQGYGGIFAASIFDRYWHSGEFQLLDSLSEVIVIE